MLFGVVGAEKSAKLLQAVAICASVKGPQQIKSTSLLLYNGALSPWCKFNVKGPAEEA